MRPSPELAARLRVNLDDLSLDEHLTSGRREQLFQLCDEPQQRAIAQRFSAVARKIPAKNADRVRLLR